MYYFKVLQARPTPRRTQHPPLPCTLSTRRPACCPLARCCARTRAAHCSRSVGCVPLRRARRRMPHAHAPCPTPMPHAHAARLSLAARNLMVVALTHSFGVECASGRWRSSVASAILTTAKYGPFVFVGVLWCFCLCPWHHQRLCSLEQGPAASLHMRMYVCGREGARASRLAPPQPHWVLGAPCARERCCEYARARGREGARMGVAEWDASMLAVLSQRAQARTHVAAHLVQLLRTSHCRAKP